MYLKRLTIFSFKNYKEAEFEFEPGANALTGPNGSGKTNVLDAVHYLGLCKSYFHSTDSINMMHGSNFFSLGGKFFLKDNDFADEVFVGMKSGSKKVVKRNHKEYQKLSEHIGLLPVVMVAPVDQILITGSGEERRRLMDSIISQYNHLYLELLVNYNRILQQRNSLLKNTPRGQMPDDALLQIINEQLANSGEQIFHIRQDFIQKLIPVFNKYYSFLTDDMEQVSLEYISKLSEQPLLDLLQSAIQKDLALQYTSVGVHRDDLELLLNNYPVRKIGSQGQQKSFVLAIKLAQFELISEYSGIKPLLLLDDIFDKLDVHRITRLMELVSNETFGQIFITDTTDTHIRDVFEKINVPLKIFNCAKPDLPIGNPEEEV
ncbi:MAG: DNA replication/repair protein RecF [Bacteroidota bacterium]